MLRREDPGEDRPEQLDGEDAGERENEAGVGQGEGLTDQDDQGSGGKGRQAVTGPAEYLGAQPEQKGDGGADSGITVPGHETEGYDE